MMHSNKEYIRTLNTKAVHSSYDSRFVISSLSKFENQVEKSPFSLKYVTSGEENYFINNKSYKVKSNQFLLVNANDKVDIHVRSSYPTKGICLYPSENLIQEITHFYTSSDKMLLDPSKVNCTEVNFTQSIFPINSNTTGFFLQHAIQNILQLHQQDVSIDYDLFFMQLVEKLLHDQLEISKQIKRLSSSKKQTREELFRRLSIVKNYIHDNYTEKLPINDLSEMACLSKYHFLRSFKALYNMSPYQYLLQLKLNKARKLKRKDYSYSEISELVGFSDEKNLRKSLHKIENHF